MIARTQHTLLMGDLETCKLSEMEWNSDGGEKFIFDNDSICIVYSAGEMTMVAYGRNEVGTSISLDPILIPAFSLCCWSLAV